MPVQSGTFSFIVYLDDDQNHEVSKRLTITVRDAVRVEFPYSAATVGVPFAETVRVSNATPPYQFALTSGPLPPGLTLNASTGLISGTPISGGSYPFRVTVTDATARTGFVDFTLAVAGPYISISPPNTVPLPLGRVGVAYSTSFSANGGTPPYRFSGRSLPAGLSLSATGTLSGTPTAWCVCQLEISVEDANHNGGGWAYYGMTVYGVASLSPTTLAAGVVGTSYSVWISVVEVSPGYSYAIEGTLPPGILISVQGPYVVVTGTPTQAGTFNFTVKITDATGTNLQQPYTILIQSPQDVPLAVVPESLPLARTGVPYEQVIQASNGRFPFTVAMTVGGLPAGLTLTSAGRLSGTAVEAGTFAFTVEVRDVDGRKGSRAYTLNVAAASLTIGPDSIPDARVGQAYSVQFTASGGVAPYQYWVYDSPQNFTYNVNSGVFSGTPANGGTFTIRVHVQDSTGNSGERPYAFRINGPQLSISPATLPEAFYGVPYSVQLSVAGGTAPYDFRVTCCLTQGLSLSRTGLISGTPRGLGQNPVIITATDATGASVDQRFDLTFRLPAITLTFTAWGDGTTGIVYSESIIAGGGVGPYVFVITEGSLPPGLAMTLNQFGDRADIKGTPTAAGSYSFRVSATDSNGQSVSSLFSITVVAQQLEIAPAALPDAQATVAYEVAITATGGTPPYHFRIASGNLPVGLSLSDAGLLHGTTTNPGDFGLLLEAGDSKGITARRSYVLHVLGGGLSVYAEAADGSLREAYSGRIRAQGGVEPYSFSVLSGSLPPGIALSTNGTLSGTPEQAGSFSFTAAARDSVGRTGTAYVTIRIVGATLVISPETLPDATAGTPYSVQVTASGGRAPYQFQMNVATRWQAQMRVTAEGRIEGTPIASEPLLFVVTASDANGSTGFRNYTLTIRGPAALTISPEQLPPTTVGSSYRPRLEASGGQSPYGFSVRSGSFPPGIYLAQDGTITGAAGSSGEFSVTVEVRDALGATATRSYTITVSAENVSVKPDTIPDGVRGDPYAVTFTAAGGVAPAQYSILSGHLPDGIALDAGGRLAGTPGQDGSYRFTVRVKDAAGSVAWREYVMMVLDFLVIDPDALPTGHVGQPYKVVFRVVGAASVTAKLSGGPPPGLSFSESTLTLEGVPLQVGRFSLTLTVTDGATRREVVREYSLEIQAGVLLAGGELPAGRVGTSYQAQVTASGGTAPYSFELAGGTLPDGLILTTGGVVQGIPRVAGAFPFHIRARDAANLTGEASYSISIQAEPIATLSAVVNSASSSGEIAPGNFATIYGENLANDEWNWGGAIPDGKTLPTELGGVSVLINGQSGWVSYAGPRQVNVLLPSNLQAGAATVRVTTPHGVASIGAVVANYSPALFSYGALGKVFAAAYIPSTGQLVAPPGAVAGPSRPAAPGEIIGLFASGLGPTTGGHAEGQVLEKDYPVIDLDSVAVVIGGTAVRVLYAGMVQAGVYQVNVELPSSIGTGDLPIVLRAGGNDSPAGVLLCIRQ